jgi:hypothetical protein
MNRIAHRLLTLAGLTRAARGAMVAGALALAMAAPAAAATPPTRTVSYPTGFVMQPGQGCAFAVAGVPTNGFVARTVFSDTYEMRSIRVKGYYENLDNHKTYWVNDTWTEKDVWDPATQLYTITGTGQIDVPFWPGDASPFGGVVTTAAFYRFAGTTVNVVDFNGVPRTADFTWSGRIIDLCAALS